MLGPKARFACWNFAVAAATFSLASTTAGVVSTISSSALGSLPSITGIGNGCAAARRRRAENADTYCRGQRGRLLRHSAARSVECLLTFQFGGARLADGERRTIPVSIPLLCARMDFFQEHRQA